MNAQNKKVVVIGAGPAGLTAAYELLKQGYAVTIAEAENAVGGISKTVEYKGNRMDLGGHRFFTKDDRVKNLWYDLLPVQGAPSWDDICLQAEKSYIPGGPDPEKEDKVMLIRHRVSRILYLRKFFDYPISMKWETFKNLGLRRTVVSGFGYLQALLFKREEKSLKDFMINRFGSPLYRMFFEKYTEKLWGKNPSEISASWGAQRIKGVSLLKVVSSILMKAVPFYHPQKVETSLIEEFVYPKRGPGQLWDTLAEKIRGMNGEILLNAEVVRVETDENNMVTAVIVRDEVSGEKRIEGDYFLSSMPVKDLVSAFPKKCFSDAVRQWACELPYRDFITVGVEVPELSLKNHTKIKTIRNIVPDCWIYIQEPDVRLGRLQIFNNWSPYMLREPGKNIWMGLEYFCSEEDDMWNMTDSDFIRFAIQELRKIHIIEEDTEIVNAVRIKVKKAYPAYFGSYEHFDAIRGELDQIRNLYCIGRNGQHRYNNMDHSMLTAKEAARLIISGECDRNALWNINAEEEYHEEKAKKQE